jgi:hypothetical protein
LSEQDDGQAPNFSCFGPIDVMMAKWVFFALVVIDGNLTCHITAIEGPVTPLQHYGKCIMVATFAVRAAYERLIL